MTEILAINVKTCSTCKETKPFDAFVKGKGLLCKSCRNKRQIVNRLRREGKADLTCEACGAIFRRRSGGGHQNPFCEPCRADPATRRICGLCKESKPMSEFPGYRKLCTSCRTDYRREHARRALGFYDPRCKFCGAAITRDRPGRIATMCEPCRKDPNRPKNCLDCGKTDAIEKFPNGGRSGRCPPCHAVDQKRRGRKFLLRKYGMTIEEWDARMEVQGGSCATCFQVPAPTQDSHTTGLRIDHRHACGTVRGLLCHNCNASIGLLREDPLTILNILFYLECGGFGDKYKRLRQTPAKVPNG